MLNVGQVVQNTETGKFAVYAGFDVSDLPWGPMQYFTPELTTEGDWTHIEDNDGKIIGNEFVDHANLSNCYFGLIDPDKLGRKDWAIIREICDRPAQPVRPTTPQPLSVDVC